MLRIFNVHWYGSIFVDFEQDFSSTNMISNMTTNKAAACRGALFLSCSRVAFVRYFSRNSTAQHRSVLASLHS